MVNQPPQHQTSSPPDAYARKASPLTQAQRDQASAWHAILTRPDSLAAAQKVEGKAREVVLALDPALATEAQMRCALAAWQHAVQLWGQMSSFVADVNRRLDAESKAAEKQNTLDKPGDSGTMAKD